MHFQLHIFRLQYSIERICAAIPDNRTLRCPFYCKFGAKSSAHHPVYPMWTVVPDIYNVITAGVFRLQYSSERIWAAIWYMSTIQWAWYCKFGAKYSTHPPVYASWTVVPDIYNAFTAPHIQCFNIQLNVSALQLQISRQFRACCTTNLVPNTAHILHFSLCEQWSRTYTLYLQLRIFRPQYSTERICATITDITTIPCALYCKIVAKYRTHRPVYAVWSVVPDIYNEITDPHI
jgi:hypothetical protein